MQQLAQLKQGTQKNANQNPEKDNKNRIITIHNKNWTITNQNSESQRNKTES